MSFSLGSFKQATFLKKGIPDEIIIEHYDKDENSVYFKNKNTGKVFYKLGLKTYLSEIKGDRNFIFRNFMDYTFIRNLNRNILVVDISTYDETLRMNIGKKTICEINLRNYGISPIYRSTNRTRLVGMEYKSEDKFKEFEKELKKSFFEAMLE